MKFNKTHTYFWVSALIIFIAGLFTYTDKNACIDINVHDTYYIIHVFYLATFIATIYLVLGIIYWLFVKIKIPLFSYLTKTHLFCSIGGLAIYLIVMTFFEDNIEIEPGVLNKSSVMVWVIFVILCAILFSQLLFLINILIGLFRGIKNEQNH